MSNALQLYRLWMPPNSLHPSIWQYVALSGDLHFSVLDENAM